MGRTCNMHGELKIACLIPVGKSEWMRHRRRWKDNIKKWILKIGCEKVD